MDHSVVLELFDHKWESYRKHCIKAVTKQSGCCIEENRKKMTILKQDRVIIYF